MLKIPRSTVAVSVQETYAVSIRPDHFSAHETLLDKNRHLARTVVDVSALKGPSQAFEEAPEKAETSTTVC